MFFVIYLSGRGRGRGQRGPNFQSPARQQQTPGGRRVRSELKSRDQILKQRKKNQKHQFLQSGGLKKLRSKNKQWLGEVKKSGFGRGGQKKGKMRKKLWGGTQRNHGGRVPWVEVEATTRNWMMDISFVLNLLTSSVVPCVLVERGSKWAEESIFIFFPHHLMNFSSDKVCKRMIHWMASGLNNVSTEMLL